MPDIGYVDQASAASLRRQSERQTWFAARRALLGVMVAAAAVAGVLATSPEAASQAAAQAGPGLTRLLRAMAGIKAMAAIGLIAVTYWRLAAPTGAARLVLYALACAMMAAGPGLIWGMAHVKLGALLLHGGVLMSIVLLWRDPEMARRLEAEIARRRARLRA